MATSPPTRLAAEVYADAQAAAALQDRSVAQQLSHWARLGREVEASSVVAARRRAVSAVLAGDGEYDALTRDEQAQVRAEWSRRITDRLEAVEVGADRHRAGKSYVCLDEDGDVVRHHPDGTVELL